jgi:hypothetical protein
VTCVERCVLCLPRTFHGPLKLVGYGDNAIFISDAVKLRLMTLNETASSLNAFIGDVASWEKPSADGSGGGDDCSVTVSARPNVGRAPKIEIYFSGESQDSGPRYQKLQKRVSIFGKMFR